MKAEQDTDLWIQKHVNMSHFIPMIFWQNINIWFSGGVPFFYHFQCLKCYLRLLCVCEREGEGDVGC